MAISKKVKAQRELEKAQEADLREQLLNNRAVEILRITQTNKLAAHLLVAMSEELDDYDELFTMQHERTKVADAAWRKAHPGNEDTLPDLGDLLDWLLTFVPKKYKEKA